MKVVVALDSFKGSLDSRAAGEAVRAGVLDADARAAVHVALVADGGEGTMAAITAARSSTLVDVDVIDALGNPLRAQYAVIEDGPDRCAVVEAAVVIGLGLVGDVDAALPARASSAGLGLLLDHAQHAHVDRVLVGLGGTATTDGGTGLLVSLGAHLRDHAGHDLPAHPNPLWTFGSLEIDSLPDLSRVTALSDVTNPLTGPRGAVQVFAPQKGATADQLHHLEERMERWGAALESSHDPATGRLTQAPGAGAAGGIGAALLACGAIVESGFDQTARLTGLRDELIGADLVITGEGSLDQQTAMGKGPARVARLARDAGAVVVGLGGRVERPGGPEGDLFDAVLPVHRQPRSLSEALDPAATAAALRATAAEVVRLIAAARR